MSIIDTQAHFDALSAAEIRDHGSIEVVKNKFLKAYENAKQTHSRPFHATGYSVLQNRLSQIPDCLRIDYERAPIKLGISRPFSRSMFMQAARHGGHHARYSLSDGDLIVIDRDVIIRSALFNYFSLLGKNNLDALFLQAFILVHSAIQPRSPIPFQYEVLYQILKDNKSRDIFLVCLNTLLDFVSLHEAGHAYLERKNVSRNFFRIGSVNNKISYAGKDACDSNRQHFYLDPWRLGEKIEIADDITDEQLDELFCDAFALISRTISDAAGKFTLPVLESLTGRLVALSNFFWLEDFVVVHGAGPVAPVNVGRMIMANRDVPVGQPMKRTHSYYKSHPTSLMRFESSYIHAGWICRDVGTAMDPLISRSGENLLPQIQAHWGNDVMLFYDMMIDNIRGSLCQDLNKFGKIFDLLHDHMGIQRPHSSISMKAFALVALLPHFSSILLALGQLDQSLRDMLADIVKKDAFDRLPGSSPLSSLVKPLCMVLLDPSQAMKVLYASKGNEPTSR